MDQVEIEKGKFGERNLEPSKSMSFQIPLQSIKKIDFHKNTSGKALFKSQLSHLSIKGTATNEHHIEPPLEEMFGFLAKEETVFFNSNISAEEFNNSVTQRYTHLTIAISWTAKILRNSIERVCNGIHFIKLENIFESKSCPPRSLLIFRSEEMRKICDAAENTSSDLLQEINTECDLDTDSEVWEPNNLFVATRCLLEDTTILLAVKS